MPTHARFRRRAAGLTCAALLTAALTPGAAHAAFAVGEQVDRGDGPNGASPWVQTPYIAPTLYARPFAISDDGRYALLTYPTSSTTRGLYRRDVQLNTLRLVLDDVRPTGLTRSGQQLSVITTRALAAADANTTADLYLVDPFTGAATLASKAPDGTALGGVTSGAITADGLAVVYSRPGGTERRLLSAATATSLSTRAMPPYEDFYLPQFNTDAHPNVSRHGLSVDGTRAFVAGGFVATPGGDVTLPAPPTGTTAYQWSLAPSGTEVVRIDKDAGGAWTAIVHNLGSGQATTVATGNTLLDRLSINSISSDGTKAHISADLKRNNSPLAALGTLDLRTGAIAQTSDDFAPYRGYPRIFSWNDRYGVFHDKNLFAIPTQLGATLPGGVDPASPLTYLSYGPGCSKPSFLTRYGGRPTAEFIRSEPSSRGFALVASQLQVTVRRAAGGSIINQFTLSTAKKDSPINQSIDANGWFGSVRLEATVTAGGRTASDAATTTAYYADKCFI